MIRYDNRDTGRSTSYPPGRPGYSFTDLACDALGILDALGIERAHVVCQSMFGGIGLIAGVDHPDRVASLTFVSTLDRRARPAAALGRLAERRRADPDPADSGRGRGRTSSRRRRAYSRRLAVLRRGRHARAGRAGRRPRPRHRRRPWPTTTPSSFDGPAGGGFGDIAAPTLVVHGDRDPVFPLPHGEALRDAIPGAELLVLEGAGHDLPRAGVGRVRAGPGPAHGRRPLMSRLRSALWLPLFDELADPLVVARLAAEAEEAGWHGCFVWDQLRWRAPVRQVADPWITLAAIATATERLRLGPMVTPLARRRPAKVARETATLDLLSGGRLILGVGIGSDRFAAELSRTGEQLDDRRARPDARRVAGDPRRRVVRRAGARTAASTTPSTASGSCRDRCTGRPCRCGSRDFPATSGRCAGPPARGLLPDEPRAPGPARRGGGHYHRAARSGRRAVRRRRLGAARRRPGLLRAGRGDLVDAGVRCGRRDSGQPPGPYP